MMSDQEMIALGIRHRNCHRDRQCPECGAVTCIYCAAPDGRCDDHPRYRPSAAEIAEDVAHHPEDDAEHDTEDDTD